MDRNEKRGAKNVMLGNRGKNLKKTGPWSKRPGRGNWESGPLPGRRKVRVSPKIPRVGVETNGRNRGEPIPKGRGPPPMHHFTESGGHNEKGRTKRYESGVGTSKKRAGNMV